MDDTEIRNHLRQAEREATEEGLWSAMNDNPPIAAMLAKLETYRLAYEDAKSDYIAQRHAVAELRDGLTDALGEIPMGIEAVDKPVPRRKPRE